MPACWRTKVTSGQASRELRRVRHLRREDLEVEAPAVVGEPRDVAPKRRVGGEVRPRREAVLRVVVPVQLLRMPRTSGSRGERGRAAGARPSTVKSA